MAGRERRDCAGYAAFAAALIISVRQGGVRPATAVVPAAITVAGGLLLAWRARRRIPGSIPAASPGRWGQREWLLPGWSTARLCTLSLITCCAVAPCDAASGQHLILIGLLITGPCGALLTGRWALTALADCLALTLGVVLGIPDQIFATITQYAFLAAVAAVSVTATASAAILQGRRP